MAKQYKIKRSMNAGDSFYKAGPHPITILLLILLLAGLVFAGILIYQPVYDFIMGIDASRPVETNPSSLPDEASPSSAASAEPESEPSSEPEAAKLSSELRAVYMPADTLSDAAKLDAFLNSLPAYATAVMIDGKDNNGNLLYVSRNEQALKWGVVKENASELSALSKTLKDRGLGLIVRIHAFNDALAARGDRKNNAIHYQNQETLWLDNTAAAGGKPWLNPYSPQVRRYLTELTAEAASLGADMVLLDTVFFPFDPLNAATFGDTGGLSRSSAIKGFVADAAAAVESEGSRLAVCLPLVEITNPETVPEYRYGGSPIDALGDTLACYASGTDAASLESALTGLPPGTAVIPIFTGEGAVKNLDIKEYIVVPADHAR